MYSIEYTLALFVHFRDSFKHKSQDASVETIVKPRNSTVQPPRDRRIEANYSDERFYPQGVEFTFSVGPYFLAHAQSGQEVGDSRPDYCVPCSAAGETS